MNRLMGLALLLALVGAAIAYIPEFLSVQGKAYLYGGTLVYIGGLILAIWQTRRSPDGERDR